MLSCCVARQHIAHHLVGSAQCLGSCKVVSDGMPIRPIANTQVGTVEDIALMKANGSGSGLPSGCAQLAAECLLAILAPIATSEIHRLRSAAAFLDDTFRSNELWRRWHPTKER